MFKNLCAVLLAIFIPLAVYAADIPSPGKDFPAEWSKIWENKCNPRKGVEISTVVYGQYQKEGTTKIVVHEKMNGALYMQLQMLTDRNGRILSLSAHIVINKQVVYVEAKNPAEAEKIDALVMQANGLTASEYQSCLPQN